MNLIVHLAQYWWQQDNLPHPSVETIASAIGVKPRTVQKRIKALQELQLLRRHERRRSNKSSDTNLYSFEGLIAAAMPFAKEKVAQKTAAIEQKKERLKSKRPKLVVNND